jgi:hypothetical protein
VEDVFAGAARRYGWASLSIRDALAAGLRDGAHIVLNWTACEWVNAFFTDRVHPSPQGYRLIADALIGLVVAAQDAEVAACVDGVDGEGVFENATVALPLWAPMSAGAFAAPLRLCNVAAALAARRAEGWHHTQTELVKGHLVHKPGWIAVQPGAILDFSVATRFWAAARSQAAATLAVTHLISYEHMGSAELSCVSGCECTPVVLEGHTTQPVSIEQLVELPVSQAEVCVLSLRVRNETQSGEHKVKLISISATAPLQDDEKAVAAANATMDAPGAPPLPPLY